jgi:alpha-beta hydrolase superfamily lysophospholipase
LKSSITTHYLGSKGLTNKEIKDYYKNLKDLRHAVNKNSEGKMALENMHELPGGLRFFYQEWNKQMNKNPKKIIFVFHGAYGNSDLFYPLADALYSTDNLLVGIDYRGHGRTGGQAGGKLGDLISFKKIYEDILKMIKKYKEEYDLPIYFLGYDIGALIAIQMAHMYPDINLEGLILISPMFRLKSTFKHRMIYPLISVGQIFSKGDTVQHIFEEKLESTYYPEYMASAKTNPLRLSTMSLRLFKNLLDLIKNTPRIAKKINFPCLILQGSNDHLVDHYFVHKVFEKWKHPRKIIRLYENAGHNLFMDKFTNEIYGEIAKFIKT